MTQMTVLLFVALALTPTSSSASSSDSASIRRTQKSATQVRLASSNDSGNDPGSAFSAIGTAQTNIEPEVLPRARSRHQVDELSFFVLQDSFLDRETPPAGISDFTQIGAHIRTQAEGRPFVGAFDVSGLVATNVEKYTIIEVPEAYIGWGRRPKVLESEGAPSDGGQLRAIFGRKREIWSSLDSEWDLGLWQPLNRFDYIHPTEQGLTGAFFGWGSGRADILIFASPLFIPEQGPSYELQNGSFHTTNPWFSEPTDTLVLFNKETRVNYDLDIPSAGSVINHASAGLMLRYGYEREEGFLARLAWVKKPRNQISLPFDGYLDLSSSPQVAMVNVHPQVAYHHLTSLDLGYRARNLGAGVSGLSEISEAEEMPANYNFQRLEPMTMVSPYLEARLFPSQFWGPRMRLSYLHTFGGDVSAEGPYASGKSVFAPRTMLRQAVGLSAKAMIARGGKWRLENRLKWIEELEEQGTIVMNELQLTMGDSWRAALSADLLGSRQPEDETRTFIARYRGNDRVAARVTYLF